MNLFKTQAEIENFLLFEDFLDGKVSLFYGPRVRRKTCFANKGIERLRYSFRSQFLYEPERDTALGSLHCSDSP